MKYVILVTFVIFGVCFAIRRDDKWPPPELLEALRPLRVQCEAETGVTDDAIKQFSDGEIHYDPKLKCYMKCLFHEFGVVNEDNTFHYDKMLEAIPEDFKEMARNMGKNCRNPQGSDMCEKSFDLHKCWKQADPEHYFLV